MKKRIYLIPFLLALLAVLALAGRVSAQQQTPLPGVVTDDQVNAVAEELYCPVCENISLDVCSTQACIQWRDLIRKQLSEGMTKQQIKDYFAKQYGDRVLGAPPPVGLNLLAYILPPAFLLGGVLLVSSILIQNRKKQARASAVPPPPPPAGAASDPYIRRMEEELKKRK
jgi:cytochrome c-type biogenesis protein CcmH